MNRTLDPPVLPGYRYLSHIGSGGFAEVYLYEQEFPVRKVAVKVLSRTATQGAELEQFKAEANVMAQLSGHASIVAIHSADVSQDGRPFLVMEYCPPPTLASRYRVEKIALEEVLEAAIRVASAVETLHRAGILHRDIKPHNILNGAFGDPKLTDFGIASATTSAAAAYGLSVPWSPPESFSDVQPMDVRVDVYALAATVYSLLAGRSPFEVPGGANDNATLMNRIERSPVSRINRPDVPEPLQALLARGMAKSQTQRHPSALAFAKELQEVQAALGLPQTRIEVFDASSAHLGETESDSRTEIKPIRVIVPEVLRGQGTLLQPKVVQQVQESTLQHRARGVAEPVVASAPVPEATSGSGALPEGDMFQSVAEGLRGKRSWGKPLAVAATVLTLVGLAGGALLAAGGQPTDPGSSASESAFEVKETAAAVLGGYVPQAVSVKAEDARDGIRLVYSWDRAQMNDGDSYLQAVWVDGEEREVTQLKSGVAKQRYAATTGQEVCVALTTVRSDGSASEPTVTTCGEAL